jgi:hypothetical protein
MSAPACEFLGDSEMWVLMLLLGLAAFAAMYGFVFACDRL